MRSQGWNPGLSAPQLLPHGGPDTQPQVGRGATRQFFPGAPPAPAQLRFLMVRLALSASGRCSHHSSKKVSDSQARGRTESPQRAAVAVLGLQTGSGIPNRALPSLCHLQAPGENMDGQGGRARGGVEDAAARAAHCHQAHRTDAARSSPSEQAPPAPRREVQVLFISVRGWPRPNGKRQDQER